jgi:hypothetical protein
MASEHLLMLGLSPVMSNASLTTRQLLSLHLFGLFHGFNPPAD